MLKRRGQLTLFVIIGIVFVLVIIGLTFLFGSAGKNGDGEEKVDESDIGILKRNVVDCFREVYRDSLNVIGIRGGYYSIPPGEFSVSEYGFIPYYYYKGNVTTITVEDLETSLEEYLLNNMDECLNSSTYSTSASFGDYFPSVEVREEGVMFISEVNIRVQEDGETKLIDIGDREVFVESDIFKMIEIANFVSEYALENDEEFCVSCVLSMVDSVGLSFESVDLLTEENDFLYFIYTEDVNRYPKVFEFMGSYEYKGLEDYAQVAGGEE